MTAPEQSYRNIGPTLEDLAIRYNSDKYYFHSYIGIYEKLFSGMKVNRLLEIGIGYEHLMAPLVPKYVHGSSLFMWRDYFPDAEIFSCDIRPEVIINHGRIHSMVCDQSKFPDLHSLIAGFAPWDVVIDDGSHQDDHQRVAAAALLPHVNPGGLYIIEDVMADKAEKLSVDLGGSVWFGPRRCDDNLVIVRLN